MSDAETMAASVREAREHTLERTLTFTDAAVAIALTLLVLPLVDVAGEVGDSLCLARCIADHWQDFFSFVLSYRRDLQPVVSAPRDCGESSSDDIQRCAVRAQLVLVADHRVPALPYGAAEHPVGLSATGVHVCNWAPLSRCDIAHHGTDLNDSAAPAIVWRPYGTDVGHA